MIIDSHAHIWLGRFEQNKRDIIIACERFGIDRVCISALGSHYPNENEIHELNYKAWKFSKEYPEIISSLCYVNPIHNNSLYVLQKGIEEMGMIGLKLWVATFCDDRAVFPLVEKCISYDLPILIHSFKKTTKQYDNETTGVNVAVLAGIYPEAKIIMAHLGGNCYDGIKYIKDCKNVWVDISGTVSRRDDIDYTKKLIGVDRILFGTDMPGGSFTVNYGLIEEADLTEDDRMKIYCKNALNLFNRF